MTRILPVIAGKYAHLKSSEKGVVLAHLAKDERMTHIIKLRLIY